jgi:hypothetical protein
LKPQQLLIIAHVVDEVYSDVFQPQEIVVNGYHQCRKDDVQVLQVVVGDMDGYTEWIEMDVSIVDQWYVVDLKLSRVRQCVEGRVEGCVGEYSQRMAHG